ncbi:MAG: DNA polymerase III subunit delta [Firmicutes bacterium]|nr:DNA polymerase III subunit delta [Bacillota bacterium]
MGYEQVQQDLKEGIFPPVCLLDGPEDYLKRKALKAIVEGLLRPEEREWGSIPIEGRGASAQSITAALATVPFGAPYGVVMVLGVEEMEDGEQEALALSLPELPAGYLVLTAAKLDRGRKLYRTVTKLGKVYRFDHLTGLGLQRWVETRAAQLGLKLPPGAVRELTGIEDLSYLDTELAKMALYHPGGALSQEEFDQLFFPGQGEDNKRIFAFVDAVGMKNTAQALSHLDGLWGLGYDYARIFGMLVRQIRLLIMAARAGGRPEVLVGQHKLNSFVAKKVCRQSVNFSSRELRQAMALLLKTDQAVKTGMPPRIALEALVVSLTK